MRRGYLCLLALIAVGWTKHAPQAPPDVNLWPLVQGSNYVFEDGCVVTLEEASEGPVDSLQAAVRSVIAAEHRKE